MLWGLTIACVSACLWAESGDSRENALGAVDDRERAGGKQRRPGQISSFSGRTEGREKRCPSKSSFKEGNVEDKHSSGWWDV